MMKMMGKMRRACSYISIISISCTCTIEPMHDLESMWTPSGLHLDSTWTPPGLPGSPHTWLAPDLDFTWTLPGVPGWYLEFTWSLPDLGGEGKVLLCSVK